MTSVESKRSKSISYPSQTIQRAERAVRCAPFQLNLFVTMQWQGVSVQTMSGQAGLQNRYTRKLLSELAAETELLWLIQVGVLRREVDGQGLTDSFRLTPLGRQLVDKWQGQGNLKFTASWLDHLYNAFSRWLRLPV